MALGHPIVVFSHLRWNFVYQRPQHLLSRLAAGQPVLFIEEPEYDPEGAPRWERSTPEPGVTVFRPQTSVRDPGFHPRQIEALTPMMEEVRDAAGESGLVAWLYTPMALPLARALRPELMVYDCMDELSMFAGAPPELVQREAELMEEADIMFTGGPSLFRAKRDKHRNVHCFASSVDAGHFGRALQGGDAEEPADQRELPHPRLGFYGVIDERLDLPLIAALADAHPEWHLVLVGPVVKIDPATLPRRPNIHYTGQRGYAELPGYLGGWDVCLLPFARNDSTRFISPTKTLEYMAAERPIVSTPITDVAEPYGQIVYLGDTHEAFIQACEAALAAGPEERARRAELMRDVLARTSWDATAASMESLMAESLAPRSSAVPA
ncbi:MAG TPA: glycosyltransferase [Gemmatimonadales bacterium]|nr:glycosyltransferase [Gemmatimonadales bacterium]